MGGFVLKLKLWWETADRTQRMVAVGGGAFLIIMIAVTSMFAMRPHMSLAFGGLSPADQGMVISELEKDGIAAEPDEHGDIMVPSDKVTEAKVKLATAGKLPSSNQYSDEALSKLGMMDTPEVEKERLKTILEGRLSDTICGVDGISSAAVHIVLAEQSPFAREAKPATASITVTDRAGSTVT
jgi:flagellar M-ring protein FliF